MMKLNEHKGVQASLNKGTFRQYGPAQLHESGGRTTYQVTGVFQNCVETNLNGRVYGRKLWEKNLAPDSDFSKMLSERGVLGMIEHPEDGITKMTEASHVVTRVWIATESEISESKGELREGDILGTLEVLPTPHGNVLRGLIEARVRWGVSSRGSGTTTQAESHLEVNDDFLLETWDVVFTPSVQRAIPKLIQEVALGKTPSFGDVVPQTESAERTISNCLVAVTSEVFGKLSLTENESGKFHFVGNDQLKLGEFDTVTSALCRLSEAIEVIKPKKATTESAKVPVESEPPAVTTESTPTKPSTPPAMSKLIEARKLKTEAIRLSQTDLKTLKASDKAALFETIDTMRVEAASLVVADPNVRLIIEDANTKLVAFAARLDENEEDAPPAPPAGGPPNNAAGGPPNNAAGGPPNNAPANEAGGDTAALLIKAADLLRTAAEGGVDAEAALALADELEANSDTVEAGPMEHTGEEPFEEIEEPTTLPEAKRAISRLQRRLVINENRTKRLNAATETLILEHRTLKESNRKKAGEGGDLYEQAAKKLANRYNKDMCDLGRQLFKQVKGELFEANKAELEGITIYSKLEEASARIVKAAATAAPKMNESAPPTPPAPPAPPAPPKTEDLCESLQLLGSLRKKSK